MIKKIVLWSVGILILLIITVVSLPFIFKDKILEKIKSEINTQVNAKVNFEGFDLTLISSFPDFTLSLNEIIITGVNEFDGDTLTTIEQLKVKADLMSIIKGGTIEIKGITIDKPYFNLLVLKDGKANWDIAKPDSSAGSASAEKSSFKMNLNHYELNHGIIRYRDESSGMKAILTNLNHSGKGDFTQDLFVLATNTSIDALDFWYGGIRYFNNTKTSLKADLDMDMVNSKYTFKENELNLNELALAFDGFVAMPGNDINMDIKFNTKKTEFRNFISLIPGVYSEGFKDLKSSGKLALDGFVKGTYNDKTMPGFGLNVLIQNGMFQYPSLPSSVNNVQMDLKILNPDGIPDHTNIDMNRLHAELATEPFDARLSVRTPVSDANLDAMVKGKINLANISKIVPMEKGTDLNGLLDMDLTAKGRMSAIEQKKYDEFNAAGHLIISNMKYTSEEYKNGIYINSLALAFNPKTIGLNNADIKIGKSDIHANGQLDNLLSYIFKNETLSGSLQVRSDLMDLNELMGTSSANGSSTDTAAMTVLEVPDKIDFTMNADIKKMIYDDMVMENLKGMVVLSGQQLDMKNLAFNMLNGNISMKGSYSSKNIKKPEMTLNLELKNVDIHQTVKTFNTVKTVAPVADHCNGLYSSEITFSSALDGHMDPVLNTLNGSGKLNTGNVVISNFEVLNKLAEEMKMDQLKQLNLSNVNLSFRFKDGRVNIDPFDVNISGIKTNIQGSNGFDQTIDYTLDMQIPKAMLGNKLNATIAGYLAQANTAAGTNLSIPDPIRLKVGIGGTVTNPVIKTNMGKQERGAVVDQMIDKAKEAFDKSKKELEEKAKAESEKLKKEAEDKAKAESERLKKEAEAKAKAEMERQKKEAEKKAKKEAEDKMKNIFKPK